MYKMKPSRFLSPFPRPHPTLYFSSLGREFGTAVVASLSGGLLNVPHAARVTLDCGRYSFFPVMTNLGDGNNWSQRKVGAIIGIPSPVSGSLEGGALILPLFGAVDASLQRILSYRLYRL